MNKFRLPEINSVTIRYFSLYKKAAEIKVDLDKNVFCLVGANGLGKSTFITIINYALTGIVKNPERSFSWYNSITRFYSKSKSFATSYFDGRISEDDIDLAEVELEFKLGEYVYSITRGFFEPDELRSFSKAENDGRPTLTNKHSTPAELEEAYKYNLVIDSGLSEFAQFAFLQSFVLTFDETHQLLFWDSAIMERVLYLFFGLDSDTAKQADKLRKEFSTYDSNIRNIQWQITQARSSLKKMLVDYDSLDKNELTIVEKHKDLLTDVDSISEEIRKANDDIQECDLNIADYSLRISALKAEYDDLFNSTLSSEVPVEKDSEALNIVKRIKAQIFSNEPFQESIKKLIDHFESLKNKSKSNPEEVDFENLKSIDNQLNQLTRKQEEFQKRKKRFLQKEKELTLSLNDQQKKIKEIEEQNEKIFEQLQNSGEIETLKNSFQEQIDRYQESKDENYRKREKAKSELKKLEGKMSKSFTEAETTFIPKFNSFARSFLGLNIEIGLKTTSKGAHLNLRIDDGQRKDSYQLSESQRYFIDIALRMALLQIGTEEANLLIDTPEGSLDIAYESRAGKMIADFSKNSYRSIMTANINSSQLLLELADLCGQESMQIEKMTDWTYLSEVQNDENHKIEGAFSKIEEILNR